MTAAVELLTGSLAAAFPPEATQRARDLARRLLSELATAQETVDQLLAEPMNAPEAEILCAGPALLADFLRDDLADLMYRSEHNSREQLAEDRAWRNVIAHAQSPQLADQEAA